MNRRGFLGTLLAAATGLALDPKSLLWQPQPFTVLPELQAGAIVGLHDMTRYLARYLGDRWSGRIVEGHSLGENGLSHQFCVDFPAPPIELHADGLDASRYLNPIGSVLLEKLREKRSTLFGELPLYTLGATSVRVTDPKYGISVRGIAAYDEVDDLTRVRFDVLTGAA